MRAGIVGYGVYVPKYRIKVEEIARIWGEDPELVKRSLLVYEKSVPSIDEDSATIAVEAARNALVHASLDPKRIGAIYVGSESHPYVVKPTATIVAAAIDAPPSIFAADYEFACKAGTAAIQDCLGLVEGGMVEYGLAIGSDTAQSMPGDALEYTASAGGAAFVIGKRKVVAEILNTHSFCTDTPDFWRRDGQEFPKHAARFTGEPAYFRHTFNAAKEIMEQNGLEAKDFDYAVFHQPNGKFPRRVAAKLGFKEQQIELGLIVGHLGNTYSASMLLGLARILDHAKEGDMILAVSYGSGAGSDAFLLRVTRENELRRNPKPVEHFLEHRIYIDYPTYAKFRQKIKGVELVR